MPTIDFTYINKVEAFVTDDANPMYSRVYGATLNPAKTKYLFPAYPPFGMVVLKDLEKVAPNIVYTAAAQSYIKYLNKIPEYIENRVLPPDFTFVTKPYDHQVEGLVNLIYSPRFGLFFEPGTGKSKIIIDMLSALKGQRALILGPPITVNNWLGEIELHGPGLKAAAIKGTPKQKRNVISKYRDYDILVASYGTVRTLGRPKVHPSTIKFIKEVATKKTITSSGIQALVKATSLLSDADRQKYWVEAWVKGATFAEITRSTLEEAGKSPQWLINMEYDVIVADESHCIKCATSLQTKAALALSTKASRRVISTGTGSLGSPQDLYPQMKFLSPFIFPEDSLKFADMFLVKSRWNTHIVTGYKNLDVLHKRIERVTITKTKDECLDLPERTIIDKYFDLSPEQVKLYNTLISQMEVNIEDFFPKEKETIGKDIEKSLVVANAAVLLNKLSQVISGFLKEGSNIKLCEGCPKLEQCIELKIKPNTKQCSYHPQENKNISYTKANPKLDLLEELVDSITDTSKVIVWAVYKAELDMIEELLNRKGLGYVRVDGSNSSHAEDLRNKFNNDNKCSVYLSQIATGIGITLNSATYMIYYSLDWSLGVYLQSIDRNYRVNQKKKTTVYRLLSRNTLDDYRAEALSQKEDLSSVLTNKIKCVHCVNKLRCLANKTEIFDTECIMQREVKRTIAKASLMPEV